MDFAFTPEEAAFRAELRAFLADELPEWWRGMFVDDDRAMPFTREFCGKLAARGWLTMAWPSEYGGQDASVWMQTVVREEMWAHEEPRGPQYMNLNYIGPLIMRFGTPDPLARPAARFSSTEAGGVLVTKVKDRSLKMVISAGTMRPDCACVRALYCLQNSMMFTPCWPSAGPTGGAGLA